MSTKDKERLMFWAKILYYAAAAAAAIAEIFFRAVKFPDKGLPYVQPINWWYIVALGLGALLLTTTLRNKK